MARACLFSTRCVDNYLMKKLSFFLATICKFAQNIEFLCRIIMKIMLKSRTRISVFCVFFLMLGISFSACHKAENTEIITTEVLRMNDFGGALLKLSPEDMYATHYELGDIFQVVVNDTVLYIPFFDGFYCRVGDMQLTAYRDTPNVEFTAPFCGLPDELGVKAGTKVTIRLSEKGGALDVQRNMAMKWSNDINDYRGDTVVFANARMVRLGRIAENRLYRSSSPFDDTYCRAFCASWFMKKNNVACVLDLSDDEEKLQSLIDDMPPYSRQFIEMGGTVCCKLKVNYKSEETNAKMLKGMIDMIEKPGPYMIQCLEGKDRTGYACTILEALCGANYSEIVADYMLSYENYFNYNQFNNPSFYNMIVSLRLNDALMYYCGIEDETLLPTINLETSIRKFMLDHGLTETEIDQLQRALCD